MQAFLLAVSPFAVSLLSQGVKKYVLPWVTRQAQVHNGWIVLSVAVIAYIGAIVQGGVSGALDPTSTTTFVTALVGFLGATGIFHFSVAAGNAMGIKGIK